MKNIQTKLITIILSSVSVFSVMIFPNISYASHCFDYVCQIDSFCCTYGWDSVCQSEYNSCVSSESGVSCGCSDSSCTKDYYRCDGCNEKYDTTCACHSTAGAFCKNGNVYYRTSDCSTYFSQNCQGYECSGGSCNPPPAAVCGNGVVEKGEECDTTTPQSQTCGSGLCAGTQTKSCINCKWSSFSACSSQGTVCSTGNCILPSGTCGTGSKSVTACDSSGACASSYAKNCTIGCPSGKICSGASCIAADSTSPTVKSVLIKNVAFPGQPYRLGDLISVSADVSDNVAVASCSLNIGNENIGDMSLSSSPCASCTAKRTYTLWNPPIIPATLYLTTVTCKDAAGNSGKGSNNLYVESSSIDLSAAAFLPSDSASIPLTYQYTIPPDAPAATLQWSIPGANCHELNVYESKTGISVTTETTIATSKKLPLDLGKDYTWFIRASANNCDTYEAKSDTRTFITCGDTRPKSDTVKVGSCDVTITTKTESNVRYLAWGEGSSGRTAGIEIDLTGLCDVPPDGVFGSSWISNAPLINVTTKELAENCKLVLVCPNYNYGYTLSSNCKFLKKESCTSSGISCPTPTGIGTNAVSLFQSNILGDVSGSSTVSYRVGECLTNDDCNVLYPGLGYACGSNNMCGPSVGVAAGCDSNSAVVNNKCCTADAALGAVADKSKLAQIVDNGFIKGNYICTHVG